MRWWQFYLDAFSPPPWVQRYKSMSASHPVVKLFRRPVGITARICPSHFSRLWSFIFHSGQHAYSSNSFLNKMRRAVLFNVCLFDHTQYDGGLIRLGGDEHTPCRKSLARSFSKIRNYDLTTAKPRFEDNKAWCQNECDKFSLIIRISTWKLE